MLKHVDPDCTGHWTPREETGCLVCTACGAASRPTQPEMDAALRENQLGSLLVQLACAGWLLLYGTRPRDTPGSRPME